MIYVDARRAASCSAPFMVIGGWARRRSTDFGPFFVYAAILFAFSALVSAVHVPGGTFIHSAVAPRAVQLHPGARGRRRRRRLGRRAATVVGRATAAPRVFGGAVVGVRGRRAPSSARSSSTATGRRGATQAVQVAARARRGRRAADATG